MSRKGNAVLILILSFVVSVVGSGLFLSLVREDLHCLCSFETMGDGDPGSFVCADGISYIGVLVGANGAHLAIVLFAICISLASPYTEGTQPRLMSFCSILPIAMFSAYTWDLTSSRAVDQASAASLWVQSLLPVTVVFGVVVTVLLAAGFLPRPRFRTAGCLIAMMLLVVAVFIEPGSVSSVSVALGALSAAVLLEGRVPTQMKHNRQSREDGFVKSVDGTSGQ